MIIVTHEMGFARDVATGYYSLRRDHRRIGPPDQIFSHPQDERTHLFLEPIRKVQPI